MKEITCPVLWLTGERDEKFTALAREAVPLLAHGQHEVMPAVGHRLPWEASDSFSKLAGNFLK